MATYQLEDAAEEGQCDQSGVSPRLRPEVLRELYAQAYAPAGGFSAAQVEKKSRDAEAYASRLRTTAPPDAFPRLLDVGCGHGFFVVAAHYAGFDVAGQEFADYRAVWQRYLPDLADRIVAAPPEDEATFGPGAFDLVTMWEVAEHIQYPATTFGAVARVLRPGGRLVLESPRSDTPVLRFLGEHWTQLIPEEHLFLWGEASLTRMLAACGLRTLEVRDSVSPRDVFAGRIHLVAERVSA